MKDVEEGKFQLSADVIHLIALAHGLWCVSAMN